MESCYIHCIVGETEALGGLLISPQLHIWEMAALSPDTSAGL